EFPLNSLKTVPIWNELEQLLDNPYQVQLCSSSASTFPLVQSTPGTTQITGSPPAPTYPAYCSNLTVFAPPGRGRPSFGVLLPPLMCHPLNYNPTTGEEMRLLTPGFHATPWQVPDQLVRCGPPNPPGSPAGCDGTRSVTTPTGVVTTGPNDPNRWVWTYR